MTDEFKWTTKADEYLKSRWGLLPARMIANNIGAKDEWQVYRRVRKLKLDRKNIKQFTKEETRYIRKMYPTKSTAAIAHHLGRDVESILNKARYLGLKKSPEYLSIIKTLNVMGGSRLMHIPKK